MLRIISFYTCRHLAICRSQIVRLNIVLLLIFMYAVGHTQSYTVDWSDCRVEQYECGISSLSGASAAYDNLDQSKLVFGTTNINITHGPEENIYCASGKIRNKNGGTSHVYSATLDGQTQNDCSWMIIEFSEPVVNISFDLIDVDMALLKNWQDELTFYPKWSVIENNANLDIDEGNSKISGTSNCDSDAMVCNTHLVFKEPLTRIRIDYCYGSDTEDNFPDRQIYNIGNIEFERYDLDEAVYINENCPATESLITIQDKLIRKDEVLEIVIADNQGMVEEVMRYTEPGVYNMDIPIYYETCGRYPLLVRVIDESDEAASQGEIITTLSGSQMMTMEIIDNEAPTFPADQQEVIYFSCNDEIPPTYNRPARDNCLEPIDINQEVWEEYLDYNDDCGQWNVRRYWALTDMCDNRTIDSIDYIFVYDENLRSFGDAEDIIEACNIFTPNGDGINDYFALYLDNLNIKSSELYIFDRSGNPKYEERNLMLGQTETNLGGDLRYGGWQSGVYVWMLRLTDPYGNTKVISREVTILL